MEIDLSMFTIILILVFMGGWIFGMTWAFRIFNGLAGRKLQAIKRTLDNLRNKFVNLHKRGFTVANWLDKRGKATQHPMEMPSQFNGRFIYPIELKKLARYLRGEDVKLPLTNWPVYQIKKEEEISK